MANNQTIKGKNLDVKHLSISENVEQLANGNGTKFTYVNYKGKKLVLQTPEMEIPFGMNVDDRGEYKKYSVDVSFKGMEDNKSLKAFYDNMIAMDEFLINEGTKKKNSLSWFKKPKGISREIAEEKFMRTVKIPTKDGERLPYPARLKLKIQFKDGQHTVQFYHKENPKEEVKVDDPNTILVRGSRVKAIIQCVGIWIIAGGTNYMCQWKVLQMIVDKPKTITNLGFLPDTDDEDEGANDETEQSKKSEKVSESEGDDNESDEEDDDNESEEDDDDSEEESEEEEEEEPEPVPEPPKKKGRKKGSKK